MFNVGARPPEGSQTSPEFKPKDASDYDAWVKGHTQKRSRKHENLVNNFAAHAKAAGWAHGTKGYHPRDLILEQGAQHLLVEAKTVGPNSEFAVREAIGQLLAYEYLYYTAPLRRWRCSQRPSETCGSNCWRNWASMSSGPRCGGARPDRPFRGCEGWGVH